MKVEIKKVIPNPSNPRIIKDDKFKKLVNSIKEFPQMLELRPIVVDSNMVVLGGNMRLRACQAAGLREVDILIADKLTDAQKAEFIIKDNIGFGEWNWDLLANEWDIDLLNDWGLELWNPEQSADYSLLDEAGDYEDEITNMEGNVMKAIQIEFRPEDYDEAYELVKYFREFDGYVGGIVLDFLRTQKTKHEK